MEICDELFMQYNNLNILYQIASEEKEKVNI